MAEVGIRKLAEELATQITELRNAKMLALKRPVIFLAAGTGTTAYYLNKFLGGVAKVVAVPVAGDERYLVKQMRWLREMGGEGGGDVLPGVLRPRLRGNFADVREDKLKVWREMKRASEGIDFDLVYAPKAWEEVMLAVDEGRLAAEEDLIYYHSGGTEGNASMLGRWWSTCQSLFYVRWRAVQRECITDTYPMYYVLISRASFLRYSQQDSSRKDFFSLLIVTIRRINMPKTDRTQLMRQSPCITLFAVKRQHCLKCLLWHIHFSYCLHAFLACSLLLDQLFLPRNISTVTSAHHDDLQLPRKRAHYLKR